MIADHIDCFFGCGAPHLGLRASAKASGHPGAIWMTRSAIDMVSA